MFDSDREIEVAAIERLREGATHMRTVVDITSARLFEQILADEEQRLDYFETQLCLLSQLGEQFYVAQLVEQPSDGRRRLLPCPFGRRSGAYRDWPQPRSRRDSRAYCR